MKYQHIVESISTKLETIIATHIKTLDKDIVSIILGWNADYTKLKVWFDTKWENHSYCGYNDAVISVDEPAIAIAIDNIAQGKDFDIEIDASKEIKKFQIFGNRLQCSNQEANEQLTFVLNIAMNMLIDCSQLICKRSVIGDFENIVSFKVENINNGNHPSTTAIYQTDVTYPLIHVKVNSFSKDEDIKCFCTISETALTFFLNDTVQKDKWETIFQNKQSTITIPFDEIESYGLKAKYNSFNLEINLISIGTLIIDTENDNYWMREGNCIPEVLNSRLKGIIPNKETKEIVMVSPHDTEAFANWCNYINELNAKFNWKDLENAVKKHGVEFIYHFIPLFNRENKYYSGVTITAIKFLIKNGDFKTSAEYFETLSPKNQEENWIIKYQIYLGLEQFDNALLFLKELNPEVSEHYLVEDYYLHLANALKAGNQGEHTKAIQHLESIPEDDHDTEEYKWTEVYLLAHINELQAYEKVLSMLSFSLPVIPSQSYFSNFYSIYALFEQKKNLLAGIRNSDKIVKEKMENIIVKKESHPIFPLYRKNLNSEQPMFWDVVDSEKHKELGSILLFFTHDGKDYAFSKAGMLIVYSLANNVIEIISQKQIISDPSCAFYSNGLLYANQDKINLISYHLNSRKSEPTLHRMVSENVDHIFANDQYIVLCSLAGAELYIRQPESGYKLIDLLSVGTSTIPYSWAKASLIIDDYLYIAGGNAGLLTYKLSKLDKPDLLHVLSCDYKNPFCDKIYHHNNVLILNMEGNHWMVDVSNKTKPVSKRVLFGRNEGSKNGPLLWDDTLMFVEKDDSIVWKYGFDNQGKQFVSAEHMAKDGMDVKIYYQSNWMLSGNSLLISSSSYGLSLLKKVPSQKMDTTEIEILRSKTDVFYNQLKTALDDFYSQYPQKKLGMIQLSLNHNKLIFKISAPKHLTQCLGYDLEIDLDKNTSYDDLGIKFSEFPFPYDAILERDKKEVEYQMCNTILQRLSQDQTTYYDDVVYFMYEGYIEQIDRSVLSLEYAKVKQG